MDKKITINDLLTEEFKDCVMAEIPRNGESKDSEKYPVLDEIKEFIKNIPDDILYTDEEDHGKETWPHITMLYGLKDDQVEDVKELLKGIEGKIRAKLGKISKFRNEKFDVLKIDVSSEDLSKINKLLKTLPNENKYPTYIPHLTLAYVKPGEGEEFVGDDNFNGVEVTIEKIIYSDKDRNHTKVLRETSGWGNGGAGYGGMVGGSISPNGWSSTFNGTKQQINKFGKSSRHTTHDIENSPVQGTEGSRSMPTCGNIVMGWSPYDSIKPEDLDVPGIDKDELFQGIRYEMDKSINPDKSQAKEAALTNISTDPHYYSNLNMYMSDTKEQKKSVNLKAIGEIIRELQSKRDERSSAVNNTANQFIQPAIKERTAGRSIESISEIMRNMIKNKK